MKNGEPNQQSRRENTAILRCVWNVASLRSSPPCYSSWTCLWIGKKMSASVLELHTAPAVGLRHGHLYITAVPQRRNLCTCVLFTRMCCKQGNPCPQNQGICQKNNLIVIYCDHSSWIIIDNFFFLLLMYMYRISHKNTLANPGPAGCATKQSLCRPGTRRPPYLSPSVPNLTPPAPVFDFCVLPRC